MFRVVSEYEEYCKFQRGLSAKTIKAYSCDIAILSKYVSNVLRKSVALVTREDCLNFIVFVQKDRKPKTVKRYIASVGLFFKYLKGIGMVDNNPMDNIDVRIREGRVLPRVINKSTMSSFLEFMHGLKCELKDSNCLYKELIKELCVIELLFSTGMRVSEVSNLKVAQVSMPDEYIDIVGKGGRQRRIPLCGEATLAVLREYITMFGEVVGRDEYFFNNRDNKRLSEQSIRNIVRKCVKKSRVGVRITPHMFRHTVATMLLENGVDIRYIQCFLGHSSITTTQIYVHVNEEAQRRVMARCHPRGGFAG